MNPMSHLATNLRLLPARILVAAPPPSLDSQIYKRPNFSSSDVLSQRNSAERILQFFTVSAKSQTRADPNVYLNRHPSEPARVPLSNY